MIKVRVNTDPENTDELAASVASGHTMKGDWQTPKGSAPGDLVVWYAAAGRQQFVASGWVEVAPREVEVEQPFGRYRGPVAGMQRIEPVDRKKVIKDCGFDGGHQGPQPVIPHL